MSQAQHQQLMHTLQNDGRTNLVEWDEQIVDEFCEEQVINERASFDSIKDRVHYDFHERFLCTVPNLLYKFLIDKGVAHIVELRPPLVEPRSNNYKKQISWWEKIVENQEWKKFVN